MTTPVTLQLRSPGVTHVWVAGTMSSQGTLVWDTFELSADEFIEQDDTVVVLGHFDVTKGDQSGRLPFVHIWRYRGEQVCRLQLLTDSLGMARVLGVA